MKKRKYFKVVLAVCLSVVMVGSIFFFRRPEIFSHDYMGLGTYVHVKVCASPVKEKFVNRAFADLALLLKSIEKDMSVYQNDSGVARINTASGNPVVVSDELMYVLKESVRLSVITRGRFDVTVGPLITLWHDALRHGMLPTDTDISSAKQRIGFKKIKFTGKNEVGVADGMKVDLGGIAKGYAVDKAVQVLGRYGFSDFLIDAGGDIFASGQNCEGYSWRIGIRNPRDEKRLIAVIPVENQAVTTSGDYEQFYEVEGKRWSHIIDPVSGYPAHQAVSATVIAPTTLEADALSTALSVLSAEEGEAVMKSLGAQYSAMLIYSHDGKQNQVLTPGFPDSF